MIVVGAVLAAVGAAVHVWIFVLESVLWRGPRARRVFGTTEEEADATASLALNQGFYNLFLAVDATASLALNQGFYNLFLAVDVLIGLILLVAGLPAAGLTALLIGTGSMTAAGLVLLVSDRSRARAAAVQATLPAIATLLLAVAAAIGV